MESNKLEQKIRLDIIHTLKKLLNRLNLPKETPRNAESIKETLTYHLLKLNASGYVFSGIEITAIDLGSKIYDNPKITFSLEVLVEDKPPTATNFIRSRESIHKVTTTVTLSNRTKTIQAPTNSNHYTVETQLSPTLKEREVRQIKDISFVDSLMNWLLLSCESKEALKIATETIDLIRSNEYLPIYGQNFIKIINNPDSYLRPGSFQELHELTFDDKEGQSLVVYLKLSAGYIQKAINQSNASTFDQLSYSNFYILYKISQVIWILKYQNNKLKQLLGEKQKEPDTQLKYKEIEELQIGLQIMDELTRSFVQKAAFLDELKKDKQFNISDKNKIYTALNLLDNATIEPNINRIIFINHSLDLAMYCLSIKRYNDGESVNFSGLESIGDPAFTQETLNNRLLWRTQIFSIIRDSELEQGQKVTKDNLRNTYKSYLEATVDSVLDLKKILIENTAIKYSDKTKDNLSRKDLCKNSINEIFEPVLSNVELSFPWDNNHLTVIEQHSKQLISFVKLIQSCNGNVEGMLQQALPGDDLKKLVGSKFYTFKINQQHRITFKIEGEKIIILSLVNHADTIIKNKT